MYWAAWAARVKSARPFYFSPTVGARPSSPGRPWSRARFGALALRSATVGVWKTAGAAQKDLLSVLSGRRFVALDLRAKGTREFARYATLLFDHLDNEEKTALRMRSRERLLRAS